MALPHSCHETPTDGNAAEIHGEQPGRPCYAWALLLADDPTGNLDTQTSIEILEIFMNLSRDQGITVVLLTHEPDIAIYAQRVITFRDGQVACPPGKASRLDPIMALRYE